MSAPATPPAAPRFPAAPDRTDPTARRTAADAVMHAVELAVPATGAPVIEEFLTALGLSATSSVSVQDGRATATVFVADAAGADALERRLRRELATWAELLPAGRPEVCRAQLRREDWAESWKRHFHAERVSARLVIKPSWEAWSGGRSGDIVLELDPGMAFGTGQHGTTRACLEFMDELASQLGPVPFLDVGCGSGILALAAARLGFAPVWAFDNDPAAVRVAAENLARAGVTSVTPTVADLATCTPPAPCRVVAANLLAPLLLEHGARLATFLDGAARPGHLIVSGILTEQYPAVRHRFEALEFRQSATRTLAEWTSGCFTR